MQGVPHHLISLGLTMLVVGASTLPAQDLGDKARLAAIVPADARLFLEIRDVPSVLRVPGGSPMAALLTDIVVASRPADTRPAGSVDLARLVADAIGLKDPHTIQLMFDRHVGLAADGWGAINDAVLLAEPSDPAALEQALNAFLVQESAGKAVRLYRITNNHELSCDGHWLVLGRRTSERAIYTRTASMLENKQGPFLRDTDEFRARMAELPAAAQGVFYMRAGESTEAGAQWRLPGWPVTWPNPVSVVIGAEVTGGGVAVDVTARLAAAVPGWQPSELPIDALTRLPTSTLAAWTHSINYAAEFARLNQLHQSGIFRIYIDLLESGQAEGGLTGRMLNHLVGDTLIMLGQHPMTFAGQTLVLPTLAVAVETDDPLAVEQAFHQAAVNFLRPLNLPLTEEKEFKIETRPLDGGGEICTIAVGRLFSFTTTCEWLNSLELAWTVADRWLIVATNAQTIHEIVMARRGTAKSLPVGRVQEALRDVQMRGGAARVLLLAQPGDTGLMIDSWIAYLRTQHPEMLTDEWWQRLRKRQRAYSIQLGIVAKETLAGVEVEGTYPGWPAHDRLKPGDVIVAVDGKPLDRMKAFAALREAIATREHEDRLVVTCERDGTPMNIEIPMPTVDSPADRIQPVELLRQLADVLRPFPSASFASWQPTPDALKAHIELRIQPPTAPQSLPASPSQPATQTAPATQFEATTRPETATQSQRATTPAQ
jgi:hypothetical protein